MIEQLHHRRYRYWWEQHKIVRLIKPKNLVAKLKIYGKLMDQCQNRFEWKEFQTFKQTLNGFESFWKNFEIYAKGEINDITTLRLAARTNARIDKAHSN